MNKEKVLQSLLWNRDHLSWASTCLAKKITCAGKGINIPNIMRFSLQVHLAFGKIKNVGGTAVKSLHCTCNFNWFSFQQRDEF